MNNSVYRYVITKWGKDDPFRTLAEDCQGRYTYATEQEALDKLKAICDNNSADRVEEFFPNAEVRQAECWPIHFDPKGVWFD